MSQDTDQDMPQFPSIIRKETQKNPPKTIYEDIRQFDCPGCGKVRPERYRDYDEYDRVSFEVVTEEDQEAYEDKEGVWAVPDIRRAWKGYIVKVYIDAYREDEETGELEYDNAASGLVYDEDHISLDELVSNIVHRPFDWSSSPPRAGDWLSTNIEAVMYGEGSHERHSAVIERKDGLPLSDREMSFIHKHLVGHPRNPRFSDTRKGLSLKKMLG